MFCRESTAECYTVATEEELQRVLDAPHKGLVFVESLMDKDDSPETLIRAGHAFADSDFGPTGPQFEPGANIPLPNPEVILMPLYTAITEQDFVSDGKKKKIAEEITRIHAAVMKVPKSFVHVLFLSYPEHSGYTAGEEAPTAALNCVLRSGHTVEEKTDLLKQLWSMFQGLTGIATDQLAISLQEIPSSNAMEMGQIMQPVRSE